ncbi:metabotropic glutamate receptor 3-like [Antedon mediterranea]|uniref:metabotropic glutamate receptor 3-like n=1 Tax=Antedon mediterranea TaxID=105859 RepID=UPI003AF807CC
MNECDLSQDGDYGVPCNKSTEFTSETFNNVDVIVSNIIDAVFIYAEALAKLHQELCGETVGICERFGSAAGQSLLSTLLTDDFTGALNQTIVFKDNGEPKHVEFDIHNVQLDNNGNSTLVKVGEWNTDTGITLDINNLQLWNSSTQLEDISISTCPDSCTICLSSSAKSFIIYGDVIFAGMFSIHDVNCSVFKTSGYVRMQAMLYAIQTINNNENILPNVTIGMEAYDTCSDSRIAGSQTYQFTSGFQQTEELFMNREQSGNQQYAIGAIGADRNDLTRSVNQQLAAVDMVQIGQLSTASTADLVNFYHVVGTDQKQARVLVDVLLQAEYKYIQILEGQYANEAVKTLKDLAAKADIFVANSIVVDEDASFDDDVIYKLLAYPTSDVIVVFLEFQEVNQFLRAIDRAGLEQTFQILASDKWGLDSSAVVGVKSVAKNSITISPKSLVNSEFESYFTGLQPNNSADPWFAEFWMGRYNCQLPGQPILYDELCTDSDVLSATDAQSRTISSVIDAVYVLSTALDMLIRDKCPEVGTICKDLQSVSMDEWLSHINETMVESLSGSDVAFDENGQVNSAVYDVNKFEELNSEFGYQTIGSWKDGVGLEGLNVAEFENVASECPYKTLPCSNENPKLSIIDGDIVIPALFSTHTAGSSALRCGSLNLEEVVAVQALIYAMDKINGDNNILPGLNLGAAVADYCGSTLMAYDQFVNIVGNSSRYGHDFAVIGPVDSVVASAIVPNAVNILGFTAISPSVFDNESASTSSAPYHIFTKQSQLPTFSTLKELVIYFNWTYIAIVYTDADYERFQAEQFTKEIEYLGVCIAVNKGIPEDGSRLQFDGIISEISTSEVGVAVAFLSDGHFSMLLESRATFGTNEANVMWVGSFPSIHDVTAFKNSPIATLSTRRQYKYDLTEFETYLKNINPLDDHGNPWFREYFEILANCRLEDEFTSPVPICEKGLTLTSVDESLLRISDLVAETIKSVYMIAQAAHNRLSTLCKENAMSICREFLEPDSKGIYNTLANVEIHPPISEESIKFNEGEIEDEIVIFNQIGDQNAKEIQVGSILSGTLLIDVTKIKSYDINGNLQEGVRTSTCPVGTLCNCKTSSPETTGETNEPDDSESIVWNVEGYWVTIVLAASATFAALILLVAGYLFYYRRHTVVIEASLNLSIWLIIGLILMYVMNLPFMVKPTVIVCGIRRVGVSFVYAIVFSALSVKIIRINRLRRRLVPEEPIGFIGASSQTLFFFVFLMAEIVLVVEWLILEHPSTVLNSNNETLCSFEKLDLVISLSYACFLVLFSLISSFGALSSSSVNSEARFIFLACVSTICCVIAWTCVYVLSDDTDYEVASVCVGLTLNSTLIFIAIFVPKVNVLCNVYSAKNERPVRNSKMGQAYANTALHTNEEEALTNL